MLNPNKVDKTFLSIPYVTAKPKSKLLIEEAEVAIEKSPVNKPQWEDPSVNDAQSNGIFAGFLFVLPVSVVIWLLIILVLKKLFF